MSCVLSVATNRNLDLAATLPSELANVVRLCLRGPGYSVSQELAGIWVSEGIDSVVFPSATSAGRNVAADLPTAAVGVKLFVGVLKFYLLAKNQKVGRRGPPPTQRPP